MLSNKFNSQKVIVFICLINYLLVLSSIFLASQSQYFVLPSIGKLEIVSLLIALVSFGVTWYNKKFYILLLPFFLLAFPSVINNIIPSYYLTEFSDRGAASYPFISFIELFILWGIYLFKKSVSSFKMPKLVFIAILLLSFHQILSLVFAENLHNFILHNIGSYQLRLVLLLAMLANKLPLDKLNFNHLVVGIYLAVAFLFLESNAFSYSKNLSKLSSGTLALNVFGNVLCMLTLVLFFFPDKLKSFKLYNKQINLNWINIGFFLLSIYMMTGTQTRMSFLSFIALFIFMLIYNQFISKRKIKSLRISLLLIVVILIFSSQKDKLSSIFKVNVVNIDNTELMEKEEENRVKFLPDTEPIDMFGYTIQLSNSTSSLFTRYYLGKMSIEMFKENPIFGIGPGVFNYKKKDYNFPYEVLIDSHNDYLSYLCTYGIFGIIYILLFLWYPAFHFVLNFRNNKFLILLLSSLCLSVCAMTNSNTFKAPVFAFIVFTSFLLYFKSLKLNE